METSRVPKAARMQRTKPTINVFIAQKKGGKTEEEKEDEGRRWMWTQESTPELQRRKNPVVFSPMTTAPL